MASIDVILSITPVMEAEIRRLIETNIHNSTILCVASLLGTDYDAARDWLIMKVAAFRGVSESDIAAMIKDGE